MTTAAEAANARTPIGADLKAGIDAISYNQEVTFTKYVRLVLPLDGYVFWVRGDLVSPPNQSVIKVMGSLHYATQQRQDADESYAINTVVFTSEDAIDELNEIAPNELYIGAFEGLNFAFSSRKNFYRQAEAWHYLGSAIYSDMRSQIIDSVNQLFDLTLIATNSLPIWLALNAFNPAWPFYPPPPPAFTLYPSFLAPSNLEPPFATVHIGDDDTSAVAAAAGFNAQSSQSQLATDRVRVTIWGASNDQALDFVSMVAQYSLDVELFGLMNSPIVRDAKRTQSELGTIAQKKVIDFEVSYVQSRVANVARQLIHGSIPSYLPAGYPTTNGHGSNAIGAFISAGSSPH